MTWRDILKGHMAGNTEWYTIRPGSDKVMEFADENKAKYRMNKLNAELGPGEPQWELYNTFGKPMLKRVWKE